MGEGEMRLLALDPSLSYIGWALFDTDSNPDLKRHGAHGPSGDTLDDKLADAARWLDWLEPHLRYLEVLAIEVPVMYMNAKTTIALAQLCGVLRYSAYSWSERTIEILPAQRLTVLGLNANLKRAVAKREVLRLVNAIYSLELTAKDNDAADAIAVGFAAIRKLKLEGAGL